MADTVPVALQTSSDRVCTALISSVNFRGGGLCENPELRQGSLRLIS